MVQGKLTLRKLRKRRLLVLVIVFCYCRCRLKKVISLLSLGLMLKTWVNSVYTRPLLLCEVLIGCVRMVENCNTRGTLRARLFLRFPFLKISGRRSVTWLFEGILLIRWSCRRRFATCSCRNSLCMPLNSALYRLNSRSMALVLTLNMGARLRRVARKRGLVNLLFLVRNRLRIGMTRLDRRVSCLFALTSCRWVKRNRLIRRTSCFLMRRPRLMSWLWKLVATLNVPILVKRFAGRTRLDCSVTTRYRGLMIR